MIKKLTIFILLFFAIAPSISNGKDDPNIIFITIDTLRPDHLSCYGYYRQTSPNIDYLAKESLLFLQAITPIPMTTPAHASIFSGLYPRHHRVLQNSNAMQMEQKVLAEILRDSGFKTAGFVSVVLLDKKTMMNRGFNSFDDIFKEPKEVGTDQLRNNEDFAYFFSRGAANTEANKKQKKISERGAEETISLAMQWLDKNINSGPVFLWVHLYDPHWPYLPPDRFMPEQHPGKETILDINDAIRLLSNDGILRQYTSILPEYIPIVKDLYDGEISYADEQIGRLFSYLRQINLYDSSVIVVMSDHGEMLGEKEHYYGHHGTLYDQTIKASLIMKLPGIDPKKISTLARSIDVMPTLLAYLGIKYGPVRDGINLLPVIMGENPSNNFFSYLETNIVSKTQVDDDILRSTFSRRRFPHQIGVRTFEWAYMKKYMHKQNKEYLYNIIADPDEVTNLIESRPETAGGFRKLLAPYENVVINSDMQNKQNRGAIQKQVPSKNNADEKERIEQLKSLGYIQ